MLQALVSHLLLFGALRLIDLKSWRSLGALVCSFGRRKDSTTARMCLSRPGHWSKSDLSLNRDEDKSRCQWAETKLERARVGLNFDH